MCSLSYLRQGDYVFAFVSLSVSWLTQKLSTRVDFFGPVECDKELATRITIADPRIFEGI